MQISSSSLCINFIVNLEIFYELNNLPSNASNSFPIQNCLFATVKLVKNAQKSKFTYNGRATAFDGEGSWSFGNDFARNVAIFCVGNRKNDFLVLGKEPTNGINDRTGVSEKN